MDYITKPTSRKELRKFSKVFRFLFGVTDDNSPFPVLNALEILPDVFKGTTLSIVEDNDLLPNVPARCFPDEYGNFTIEIKETVYKGAFEKQIGAYLDFICHEEKSNLINLIENFNLVINKLLPYENQKKKYKEYYQLIKQYKRTKKLSKDPLQFETLIQLK